MNKKTELRYFPIEDCRAESTKDGKKISGYAAVFEALSQPMWGFREKIAKGAFKSSLKDGDIRALWSHNTDMVLGRTKSGTLSLREDDHGLFFDLVLPDTSIGNDAYTLIERKDVTGVSFGFQVQSETWDKGSDGQPHVRTLNEVKLFEISPTAFPAYEQTNVEARDLSDLVVQIESKWAEEQRDAQRKEPSEIEKMKNKLKAIELGLPFNL